MDTIIITLEDGSKKEYKKGIKVKEIINLLNKEELAQLVGKKQATLGKMP